MSAYFDLNDLHGRARTYDEHAEEAAFLLGGIGTGNVSVGSRGELRDWEIFNWPGKGNYMPFTFFAIRVESETGDVRAAILESEIQPPHDKSHGYYNGELAGLPRFRTSRMWSLYPYVFVELSSPDMPVSVVMEAFTPFVPLDEDASGIPGAVIRYHVKNLTDGPLTISVVGSLTNAVGFDGYDVFANLKLEGAPSNELRTEGDITGLDYRTDIDPMAERAGSMAFFARGGTATYRPEWLQGQWTDNAEDFWDDFVSDGALDRFHAVESVGSELDKFLDFSYLRLRERIGSICLEQTLDPGATDSFEFVFSWYVPNRPKGWVEVDAELDRHRSGGYDLIRNHYALTYGCAWSALMDLVTHLDILEARTQAFTRSLYETTVPDVTLEAITDNLTVIRSHTCFWLEDGNFYGWEGIRSYVGCGTGNVNHVWNYAQSVAYLFPRLEQTMRRMEFVTEIGAEGDLPFRSRQSLDGERWKMVPAADGEMGAIIRACREWKVSGDDDFLKEVWPGVKAAVEFSKRTWDADGDLVPDSQQNNTYDIEFYGANGMMATLMVGALQAASEMARGVGDEQLAETYAREAQESAGHFDDQCWNGSFYVQKLDDVDEYRYQFGNGIHSDQLLGLFVADNAGLDHLLPEEHIRSALRAIVEDNYVEHLRSVGTVQRVYALNDEPGLVLCSWPDGGRPRFPFGYADEVWTGVEYGVASLLAREGMTGESEKIVTAIRSRYDGIARNPWSEIEAGYHYTRSMASYGLLTGLSGFVADLPAGVMSFHPCAEEYRTFWSHGVGWGTYEQARSADGTLTATVRVIEGSLGVDRVATPADTVRVVAAS